ncbi:uncharacterized protein LOC143239598 isoform X2 [Tachypleus tridentatus]|uniref:uncharacterized protein LOC143239598 isoform X2 n=1 Tax=Tachypleus tridentatus TaxID=6853 RepID=UPI003FD5A92C
MLPKVISSGKCTESLMIPFLVLYNGRKGCHKQETEMNGRTDTTVHDRNMADVSPFTLEKRIVTSTWVHERKNTGDTLDTITVKFRERLNKDPQTCQTGIANCLKLATLRMHLVQEDQLNVESCAGLE